MENFLKIVALTMVGYVLIEFGPRVAQFADDVHAFRQQSAGWQASVDGIKKSIDDLKVKVKFWEPSPAGDGEACKCGCGKPGCTCGMQKSSKQPE